MKKNLLFVMNNLSCGGAEKALISLLETIDYSKFNVDLFLFKHEGLFFSKIPKQVNLLKEPYEYKYYDMPIKRAIISCIKKGRLNIALSRLKAGFIFKTEQNRVRCEQRVWKYICNSLKSINKKYDVAIGYLEKTPIYFCVDKVNAKKKIGFIHNDYDKLGMDPEIDQKYFDKLGNIVTVSEECASVLKQRFPVYKDKVEVMYNIVSPKVINKMSSNHLNIKYRGVNLVSLGRLHQQKGFELAIEACKNLIDSGYKIKWHVIGEGEERTKLEKLIKANRLEENFILLGLKENPYPYIKNADIYVHPSRFEGKSIAIDEAKILNKPIVVTNFTTVKDQIKDQETGLIVDMTSSSIAEGIKRLLDDDHLRGKLTNNLSKEKLGTESEIEKLYKLFNAG
ncbi:glycosyltransferase [Priestia aryabhattai]|uniref:glycosyltransferase n=1 Tax=Priestia TaxID=2800373 RepID=UPI00064E4862|nr:MULTISPECIES: glycosyltransferase [Priestia]AWD67020.1 glycosyltransferase [Priestia megaterium]KML27266.1 glycosyl transferase family 1 [Priestia aryabhattai]KMN98847.1 glycosyl transferase family 1 [Priestia aryabhattai]MED3960161.1 glycosyltransferase [Priestia aryabhattai]MED3992436.1 glycosyltransferase [Priestia aryabhattai]